MPAAPKNVNLLNGKKVMIIGGTSGLGFSLASALIEEGVEVVVSSSTPAKVEAAVQKLSDPEQQYNASASLVSGHPIDLSAGPKTEARLDAFFDKIGAFDHLVYTAGDKLNPKPVTEVDYNHILSVSGVRFFSAILAIKAGLKKQNNGGSITLTGGLSGEQPVAGWPLIGTFSAAFGGLVRGLALDLSPRNIRVNLVVPGAVKTELWTQFPQPVQDYLLADAAKKLTGKAGTPEELAQSYLYLIKSTNVTGEVIASDSGARLGEQLSA